MLSVKRFRLTFTALIRDRGELLVWGVMDGVGVVGEGAYEMRKRVDDQDAVLCVLA